MTPKDSASMVGYFDELLRGDLCNTRALLSRAIEDRGLVYKGAELCDCLRPFFLDAGRYRDITEAAAQVARGVSILGRQLAKEPTLRAQVALDEEEECLIHLDRHDGEDVIARMDGFMAEDGSIRFIEYNPMPSGFTWAHDISEAFSTMPILRSFERRYPCRFVSIYPLLLESLIRAHAERGGTGHPNVAILEQSADASTESLLALPDVPKTIGLIRAAGFAVRAVRAENLVYRGGQLSADGFRIDSIIASNWTRYFREAGSEASIWRAVKAGAAWILNSPSAEILRANKSTFALLSELSYSDFFPSDVSAALRRHVPWTRALREGPSTYDGKTVDLVQFVEKHRETMVLKPAKGSGGNGVTMGWLCDSGAWRMALDAALRTPHVVQERVQASSDSYPILQSDELKLEWRFSDLNPFVWNGTLAAGCLIRLSKTALMNVSAGSGSIAPMFLID